MQISVQLHSVRDAFSADPHGPSAPSGPSSLMTTQEPARDVTAAADLLATIL